MSGQDWIALVLAGIALFFAVRWIRKSLGAEAGCGCSSGKPCRTSQAKPDSDNRASIKPLVPLTTSQVDKSDDGPDD